MRIHSLSALFMTTALLLVCASQASAQEPRTWVSNNPSVADDANLCTRDSPCKTFAGAISKTAAGGEISAIDSGAFGAVTITKAITIDVSNVEGGTVNAGSVGVIVNAGVTDVVVLRGLDVYGTSSPATPPCGFAGTSGIRVIKAGSVHIEDSHIGRQQKAIEIVPATAAKVFVNRVEIADNCAYGIIAAPTGAGTAAVTVDDSTISNSGTALSIASNAGAWLSGSMLFGNALGYQALGSGVINDVGDNQLVANTVDGTATNPAPAPPAGPAGAAGATGTGGVAGPPGVAGPAGEAAVELLLATSSSRRTVRAGSAVVVRFAATAAASSTLTISRAGKTLRRLRFKSRAGSNAVRWNGRIGNARTTAGTYTLTLKAVGADGQIATRVVTVTVKRR